MEQKMEDKRENNLEVIENKTSNKKIHIETLRCIAIFFVIFNHTGIAGFQLYAKTANEVLYVIFLAISVISKAAVPIFFMISGALLLGKEESIKTLYKKRILKIVLVIIIASFLVLIFAMCKFNQTKLIFSTDFIILFFKNIYSTPMIVSYWFLYLYLAFLIMLPFLRNLVKNMKKETYYYLFIIYVIYKLIMPIINQLFDISLNSRLTIYLLEINIICPIIGYYCEHILDVKKISNKMKIGFTILIIATIICAGILTTLEIQKTGDKMVQTYLEYGEIIIAMYIFILVKSIFKDKKLPKLLSKMILTVGSCSFGIYLMETVLRYYMLNQIILVLNPFIKTMPACIIGIACIIFVGTIITMILKKIPYIKELL